MISGATAGIDLVVVGLSWVVDVNPRPAAFTVGIVKVKREELAGLILRARFGTLSENGAGECEFRRDKLEIFGD